MPHDQLPKFSSFFWGGFECLHAKVENHHRANMLHETKHDEYVRQDYQLLKQIGITTVREGLAWHSIDLGSGKYNFYGFEEMMRVANEEGIEQIWDLNHFDFPDDISPFGPEFVPRFAAYAKECVKTIRKHRPTGTLYLVPMNEISFFTFIAAHVGVWAPYAKRRGPHFKKQLVRAAIAAMDAIWSVEKNVRFIQVDPLFRRVARQPASRYIKAKVAAFNDEACEAWDMLCGKINPEVGGAPKYLDIVGLNYYFYNQEWIHTERNPDGSRHTTIPWDHPDRISMATMMQQLYARYGRPMVVTETGAWGALRRQWWIRTFKELHEALKIDLPILGMCAYPVIDRPDWSHGHLTNSGLWDFSKTDPTMRRIPHSPSIRLVQEFIKRHPTS